ncbi:MAG: hypothetical protein ACE1ZI_01560 [Acidobacteriota bacterium]|nr:hypothetical protein [Acidobacteriota bacterium]
MNWPHVHLLLNHVPVMGVPFGFLLLAAALARKSLELTKASLGVFAVVALVTIPVYLAGEPAEEVVEHLPGISESFIEEHEESALLSLVAIEILGVLAVAGLVLFRGSSIPTWFVTTSLVLSLLAAVSVGWTANLGREIHHPEIRSDFSPASEDDQDDELE